MWEGYARAKTGRLWRTALCMVHMEDSQCPLCKKASHRRRVCGRMPHKNTEKKRTAVMDKLKAFESFVSVATRGSLTPPAKPEGLPPALIGPPLDALQ